MLVKLRGFELGCPDDILSAYLLEKGFKEIFSWSNPETDGEEVVSIFEYEEGPALPAMDFFADVQKIIQEQKLVKMTLIPDSEIHP